MANFKIGETVFLTEEAIDYHKKLYGLHGSTWMLEFSKSRGLSLILADLGEDDNVAFLACPDRPDWGVEQFCVLNGKLVNTWRISVTHIESRNGNTISLHELNRGFDG